jgi:WD40 repeat protein
MDVDSGRLLTQAVVTLREKCRWPKVAIIDADTVAIGANQYVHLLSPSARRITKTVLACKGEDVSVRSLIAIPPLTAATGKLLSSGYLVTGCSDGVLKVWDAALKRCIQHIRRAHEQSIERLLLSPSREALMSVCADNVFRLWRSRCWEPEAEMQPDASDDDDEEDDKSVGAFIQE